MTGESRRVQHVLPGLVGLSARCHLVVVVVAILTISAFSTVSTIWISLYEPRPGHSVGILLP